MTKTLPTTNKTELSKKNHTQQVSPKGLGKDACVEVNRIRRGVDHDRTDEDGKTLKLKQFEVNQRVTRIIAEDMSLKGKFFCEDKLGYYLDEQSHQLIALGDASVELSILLSKYDLNSTEKTYEYVAEELYLHSLEHGDKATVYRFSHLKIVDGGESVLYILAEENRVYRITKDSVKLVDNGTNGVLFVSSKYCAPKDIPEKPVKNGRFKSQVLDIIPFNTETMTIEECQHDFRCWTLSVIMRELIKDKTILALIGPKGSGKTTAIRAIGETLYGPSWDVMPPGRNERDFDTVITTLDLIGLDNVDGTIVWLNDKLAVIATGGTIPKRILYTTNRLAEFRIRAMVALSSRTPKFRRDDVAERLRIIETVRIEDLPGRDFGSDILKPIQESRTEIWEDLIAQAQDVLRIIDETDWRSIQVPKSRMQEYARFTVIVGKAIGCEETARTLAIKQRKIQEEFVIEDDVFLVTFLLWVKTNSGVKVTASQLNEALRDLAESRGEDWPYPSGKSIAQKLRHAKQTLESYMDISERKDKSLNQMVYSFRHRNQPETDVDSGDIPQSIPVPQTRTNTDTSTTSRNYRNQNDIFNKEENKEVEDKKDNKVWWNRFRSFRFPWSPKEQND